MLFQTKIHPKLISLTIADAAVRFPGLHPVVLVDEQWDMAADTTVLNCRTAQPNAIDDYAPGTNIFIYACDQDDLALPFLAKVVARGDRFLPVYKGDPALYINIDEAARRAVEHEHDYQHAHDFAKFDHGPYDFINITQALHITRKLPGAYVEIGCFRGSSAGIALRYLQFAKLTRECFFLDVFEGFTYDAALASTDAFWMNSHQTEGPDLIAKRLSDYASDGVGIHVQRNNIITDELPAGTEQICAANLDVDMYEAVVAGLAKLHPRMVPGGIIIVEDAGHTPWLIGARIALEEFIAGPAGDSYTSIYMQSGQTFLVRK